MGEGIGLDAHALGVDHHSHGDLGVVRELRDASVLAKADDEIFEGLQCP
jgi:hypothetical protein